MAHYPTPPVNGQKCGANLCPRPNFNNSTLAPWVGGSVKSSTVNGSAGPIGGPGNTQSNALQLAFNSTSKITLPGVPVAAQGFKIWVFAATGTTPGTVGVRPVGSSRVGPVNMAATATGTTYGWTKVTDAILAGDTGSAVELYVNASAAGGFNVGFVRVDYDDTTLDLYFDGKTTDTPTADYGWDGTAYTSQSSALALGVGDTTPPSAPTALVVTQLRPVDNPSPLVGLTWQASTDDVAVAGYNVYEDGFPIATNVPGTSTYQRTYPTGTSHAYTVTAVDLAGNESAHSTTVASQPPTPLNLRQVPAGPGSGNDWQHVAFQWDAVTHPLAVQYKVYEGLSLQNEYTTHPTDYPAKFLAGVQPRTDSDRLGHSVHRFAVSAIDSAGKESPMSGHIDPITDNKPVQHPTVSMAGVTFTTADIYWEPGQDDNQVIGYDIWIWTLDHSDYRKVNPIMIPFGSELYRIDGLVPNSEYGGVIVVWDWINQSSSEYTTGGTDPDTGDPIPPWPVDVYSSPDFAVFTPPSNDRPPTQPTNLHAISIGSTNVVLGWNRSYDPDNVDIRPFYVIYENGELARDKDGTIIGDVGSVSDVDQNPATQINMGNLAPASTHHYVVLATDGLEVLSEPSEPLTVTLLGGTPPPVDTPPSAPTGLAVLGTDDTTATLGWIASTDDVGVAGYNVYLDGVKFNGPPITATTYVVIGLTPGTAYNVRLRAVDTIGQTSPFSAQVTATTTGTAPAPNQPPSTPTGLVVTGVTDTTVGLAWDTATDDSAVAGYQLWRDSALIAQIAETTYTDSGLVPGTQHTYTVKARDDAGLTSPASAQVTATTTGAAAPVAAPTGLHTLAITDTTVELAWDDNTDPVTGYHVYRGGVALTGSPITAADYTAGALTPGTTYSFTVKAVGTVGQLSPASAAVTATTTGSSGGGPDQPPPESVTGQAIADFLQQGDNPVLVATADPLAETVTLLAQGYTRGAGFTAGQPNQEIAAVITMATARLAAHPEQIPMNIGTVSWRSGSFTGWSLPELFVLNRYRQRYA